MLSASTTLLDLRPATCEEMTTLHEVEDVCVTVFDTLLTRVVAKATSTNAFAPRIPLAPMDVGSYAACFLEPGVTRSQKFSEQFVWVSKLAT